MNKAENERDARLAAALRANLRRRKAQTREQEDAAIVGTEADDSAGLPPQR